MFVRQGEAQLPPVFLGTFSSGLGDRLIQTSAPASATWSATNRIIYVPVNVSRAVVVYRFFWLNGATVGTNNLQAAIYDTAFNRVAVGTSTLSAGANACQFDNVTDFGLAAGRYYFALWCNGTTATVFRSIPTTATGVYYETHASGPQATGTPADPATNVPYVPFFGVALRATDP